MSKKFYAVKTGRKTGIFKTWDECKAQVSGFSGAVYKGFDTLEEADDFLKNTKMALTAGLSGGLTELPDIYAFVDGSFNVKTSVYGYGGFLVYDGKKEIITGSGDDPEMADMRNVAGEISGCMAAVKRAVELGLRQITVFYDYTGIENWAIGAWKTNKTGTKAYKEYFESIKDVIDVHFVKVKGHSGIPGNEEADRLAKEAAGI